ncbi:MAG: winged helix-turn-helix transcriptional regulator [Candidatus Thorarchaeota archaeon]|jgi:Lrp/AsnC family leucine-responsive transcriptional regulator
MSLKTSLDPLDLKILHALEEHGTKVSTRELSELLDEPSRTIRYRISKLKEKGILCKAKVQTHERKLGLAEYILIASSIPSSESKLKKVLDEIPAFYYYSTSYGKFEGFFIYTVYPLNTPRVILDLASELKKKGLIEDYYLFDVVDYRRYEAKLSEIEDWDWEKWSKSLPKIMSGSKKIDLDMEEFPQTVSFDSKDTLILRHMVEEPDIKLRELGEILDLSQPQVHNRVKKLEESGIIKGYKLVMKPYSDSGMTVLCFFKSKDARKILLWFDKLPYYHQITMESSSHFFVQVYVPSSEANDYLKHIRNLREYTDEMFVQILVDGTHKGYCHLIDMYSEDSESWRIPYEEFVEKIDAILKEDN